MIRSTAPNRVQSQIPSTEDEIDLRQTAKALGRQKILIACIICASALLSSLYAYTRKPIWEGQFQIVLEQKEPTNAGRLAALAADNPLISNIVGFSGGGGGQLKTEVKVLESPSVLKPTFNFVKAYKDKAGEDVSNWSFREWRDENLGIELEKGTSVLKITYRDTDSDLILPVIKRISSEYQSYSGRDRSKSIINSLAFAREQVEKFRQKAATSSRALDAFSIRYGIANSGEPIGNSGFDVSKLLISQGNLQIDAYKSPVDAGIKGGDALEQLAAINQELIRRQQRFTSRDPGVLALIRERDALRRYIEVTAGGSLTLPGQQPASKEQAQEVILQFKELNRIAKRDSSTLDSLESSLLSLQLEQARQTDPWELISTPTMLDTPVAPQKKRIITVGLLCGVVLGCGIALIVDRRSGLVFSEDELDESLPGTMLGRLRLQQPNTWPMTFELLAQGPLNQAKSVALIPVGQPEVKNLEATAKALQMALGQRSMVMSQDLVKTRSCDTQVLLVEPGHCSRSQLSQIKQSLNLQSSPVAGWLLLDPTAEAV